MYIENLRAQLPAVTSLTGYHLPLKWGLETHEMFWSPFFLFFSFLALVSFLEESWHYFLQRQVGLEGSLNRAWIQDMQGEMPASVDAECWISELQSILRSSTVGMTVTGWYETLVVGGYLPFIVWCFASNRCDVMFHTIDGHLQFKWSFCE